MIHYVCQDGNNFIVKDITGKTLQVTFDQFCTMLNGKKGTFLSFLDSTGNIQVYSASKTMILIFSLWINISCLQKSYRIKRYGKN